MVLSEKLQRGVVRYIKNLLEEQNVTLKFISKNLGVDDANFCKKMKCERKIKGGEVIKILELLKDDSEWLQKEIRLEVQGSKLVLANPNSPLPLHTIAFRSVSPPREAIALLIKAGLLIEHQTWILKHYVESYASPRFNVYFGNVLRHPGCVDECLLHFTDLNNNPEAATIFNSLIKPDVPPVISRIDFAIQYKEDIARISCANSRYSYKNFKTKFENSSKYRGIKNSVGEKYVYYQRFGKTGPEDLRIEARLRNVQVNKRKLTLDNLKELRNPFEQFHVYRLLPKLMGRKDLEALFEIKDKGFSIQCFGKENFDKFIEYEIPQSDLNHPKVIFDNAFKFHYLYYLADCLQISPKMLDINPNILKLISFSKTRGMGLKLRRSFGKVS